MSKKQLGEILLKSEIMNDVEEGWFLFDLDPWFGELGGGIGIT